MWHRKARAILWMDCEESHEMTLSSTTVSLITLLCVRNAIKAFSDRIGRYIVGRMEFLYLAIGRPINCSSDRALCNMLVMCPKNVPGVWPASWVVSGHNENVEMSN